MTAEKKVGRPPRTAKFSFDGKEWECKREQFVDLVAEIASGKGRNDKGVIDVPLMTKLIVDNGGEVQDPIDCIKLENMKPIDAIKWLTTLAK